MPATIRNTLSILADLRGYILLAGVLFAVGAVAGNFITHLPDAMIQSLFELARELKLEDWFTLAFFILVKNALAALVAIYGGFILGIIPFVAALTNGMMLGRAIMLYPGSFWLILPHGVFELTAIIIAWGLGFWCAGWIRHAPRGDRLQRRAGTSLKLFTIVILPLLTLAAAIEATGIKLLTGT